MSKFNSDKDYHQKLYKEQVKKSIKGGNNSNTLVDRVVAFVSKTRDKQVKTIDKADQRGINIKVEIEQKKENSRKAATKTGNQKKR